MPHSQIEAAISGKRRRADANPTAREPSRTSAGRTARAAPGPRHRLRRVGRRMDLRRQDPLGLGLRRLDRRGQDTHAGRTRAAPKRADLTLGSSPAHQGRAVVGRLMAPVGLARTEASSQGLALSCEITGLALTTRAR